MKLRIATGAVVVSLLGITLLYASYDWATVEDLSSPHTFNADWTYDTNKHVNVTITRGAYDQGTGTVEVSAAIVVDDTDALLGVWVQSCQDTNSNGKIESTEWTVRATGSFANFGSQTKAKVDPFELNASYDGYRLLWEWDDGTKGMDMVLRPGLTAEF